MKSEKTQTECAGRNTESHEAVAAGSTLRARTPGCDEYEAPRLSRMGELKGAILSASTGASDGVGGLQL